MLQDAADDRERASIANDTFHEFIKSVLIESNSFEKAFIRVATASISFKIFCNIVEFLNYG